MLNDKIKGAVIGLLVGSTLTGGIAFAKSGSQWIEAVYSDIKLYVNGNKVDTSYNEPFIYNGSTYLPVRAVGEALGQFVEWDGNTKTVSINSKPSGEKYLMDVCPPYDGGVYEETFRMAGKNYSKGFTMAYSQDVLVNLDGKYSTLNCIIGHPDNYLDCGDGTIRFYVDGYLVKEAELADDELPKTVSVPLNYGLQLKIESSLSGGWNTAIGIANITVE